MVKKHTSAEDFDGTIRRKRATIYRDIMDIDEVAGLFVNRQGGALDNFWRAVSKREHTGEPVDILTICDSTYANAHALLSTENRVPEKFVRALASKLGGGWGVYYQAMNQAAALGGTWPIVCTGTTDAVTTGLGAQAQLFDADGDTMVVTAQPAMTKADRFLIAFSGTGVVGQLQWNINGGAWNSVTVNVNASPFLIDCGSMSPGSGNVLNIRRTPSTGGSFYVEGVMIENGCRGDKTGFRLWEGSHSGYGVDTFSSDLGWASGIRPNRIVDPDLIICGHGINDRDTSTSVFRTNYNTVMSAALTYPTAPSVILSTPWGSSGASTDDIAPYCVEILDKASDDGFGVVDMHAYTRHFMATDDYFSFDGIHPVDRGTTFMVRFLLMALGLERPPSSMNYRYEIPGTYNILPPRDATQWRGWIRAGGGSGGAGRRGATSTVRCGGGGGASGSMTLFEICGMNIDETHFIYIGVGGAQTAQTTVNDSNGANGTTGESSFISTVSSNLGAVYYTTGGGNGGGGTNAVGLAGAAPVSGIFSGAAGSAASATGGAGTQVQGGAGYAGGGGSGAGLTTGNLQSNGGPGGSTTTQAAFFGALGALGGVAGGANPAVSATMAGGPMSVTGAGGGASSAAGAGQDGAAGKYGAGGGGGGASLNGQIAGRGGKGGDGVLESVMVLNGSQS